MTLDARRHILEWCGGAAPFSGSVQIARRAGSHCQAMKLYKLICCLVLHAAAKDERMCLMQRHARQVTAVAPVEIDDASSVPEPSHSLIMLKAEFQIISPQLCETLFVPGLALILGVMMQSNAKTHSAGLLMAFFGAQTAMNLYMKQVFSSFQLRKDLIGFPAPFAVTALQQLTAFAAISISFCVTWCLGKPLPIRMLKSRQEVGSVMILALAFVCNIGLNNLSLSILDISVHLIIRTAGALVNLLLEFLAAPVLRSVVGEEAKRPVVSCRDLVLTLLGTAFALLVVLSKMSDFPESQKRNFYVGIIVCCLSMVASGCELIVVRVLSNHLKLNALEAILNMSLPAAGLLILPTMFFRHSVGWPNKPPMTDWEVMSTVWKTSHMGIVLGLLSGIFATLYNVMLYTLSGAFQSHMISMAANFNKIALMFLSVYLGLELMPEKPWRYLMISGILGNALIFLGMGILKAQEAPKPAK
ncbi:unnamed protein product [Effrenium voratum]|nr:unnamed protein product [Effrenium voratum]